MPEPVVDPPVVVPPVVDPPAVVPPVPPVSVAPVVPPVVVPPVVVPPVPPKAVTLTTGDEDIPPDAELIHFNPKALSKRLEQATRSELKKRFGTDNPDEITAKLKKLSEFEATQEQQRLAGLSELEREKEARVKAENKAEALAEQIRVDREETMMAREDARVGAILEKHLKPKYRGAAIPHLGTYLTKTYTPAQLDDPSKAGEINAAIEKWVVEEYVKEYPEQFADYETKIKGAVTPPPVTKKPLTNGANTNGRPTAPTTAEGQENFSPNGPNAMTSRQARDAAARKGFSWM